MRDSGRTKRQLVDELVALRKRVTELEDLARSRAMAEQAVQQTEREFHSVLEHCVDMIYRLNLSTGTYDYVSPSSKQQVGYSPEEIVAIRLEGVMELVHPEDRRLPRPDIDELTAHIVGAVPGDVRVTGEYRFRHKQLGYRWVSDTRSVVFDEKGAPVAIVGSLRDITERRNAEDALRRVEREFRGVLENSLDAIYRLNLSSGTYDYMSPSSKSLLGYTPEECVALGVEGLSRLVHPEDFDAVAEDVGRILARILGDSQEEVVPTSEYRFKHKELGYRWMSDTRSIVFDENDTAVAVVGILHDITRRKMAAEAVRESEEKYHAIFSEARDGIALVDAETGFVHECNSEFERLAGRTLSELRNMKPWELRPVASVEAARAAFLDVKAKGQGGSSDLPFLRPDGTITPVEFRAKVVTIGGRPQILTVCRDITERKQAEGALRRSEERFRIASQLASDLVYERDMQTGIATYYGDIDAKMGYGPGEYPRTVEGTIEHIHPEDLPRFFELSVDDFNAGEPVTVEYRRRKKDGSYAHWLDRFALVRDEATGRPVKLVGAAADITERKQAEQALRESEERFRIASQLASDVVYERDMTTGVATFYGELDRRLGYERGGFPRTADAWAELVHPDDIAKALESIAFQLSVGDRASSEYRLRRKDGSFGRFLDRFSVLRDPKTGKPAKMIGVATEVSELRRAEEELRASEQKHRLLAENVSDVLWTMDMDLRFTYISPSVVRLRGLTVEEAMAERLEDIFPPFSLQALVEAFQEGMVAEATGQRDASRSWAVELEEYCKDRSLIWVEIRASLLRDRDGRPVGFVGVTRDITERRRAETELRESQAKLQLVLDSTLEGIAVIDLEGTILEVNQRLVQMTGARSKGELVGKSALGFVAAGERGQARAGMQFNVESGVATLQEHRVIRQDGSELPVEGSGTLVRDASGNPVGFVTVVRDITERKRAEAELRLRDTAIENSLSAIAMSDMEGRITYVNKACLKIWGSDDKEDLLGKPFWALAQVAEPGKEIGRAILRKGAWEGEVIARNKDGREVIVQVASGLVRDDRGHPTHTISSLLDVTERRRAEEAVRASERRYRLLAENARDIIWTADLDLNPTYVSPSVERLLGYGIEEVSSRPVTRLFTPGSLDVALNVLRTELARERAGLGPSVWGRIMESEVYHKDGHTVWVETRLAFLHDQHGQPTGILGITRDITDRKKAEQALRDSEAHYSALVGNLADAVFEFKGGVVTWCNERVEEIYGYPKKELLGKKAALFYPSGTDPRGYAGEVSRAMKERGVFRGVAKARRKDGGHVDIEYSLSLIPGKEPVELIAVARNVTDRVRAEEALRESESNFRSVLENSRDMIHRLNLKTRTWDYVSPASKDLLGYSPEECKALGFDGMSALVHPDDLGGLKKDLEKLATRSTGVGDEEVSVTSEYRFKHKELGYRWLSDTRSVVCDEQNRAIAVVGTVRDITERRQYSERLEQMVEQRTQQLKDAQEQLVRRERLAILGQLAGGVGHELRNPLGAIKNAVYFLNMVLEKPEADVKETLDIVDKEVATCERIISSLLDFARQRPPLRRKSNMNTIVREALLRVAVPGNVIVVTQLDEALPAIQADPSQLRRVFGNLLLNAVQAMPSGGRLVVTSEALPSGWVGISFADTGVGIAPEGLVKLFEPLFSTKAKGIGLGLPLSKALVEGHGGTIEVRSELGKGSTFTVRLPVSGS